MLWEDGDRVFCRGAGPSSAHLDSPVLWVVPAAERPAPATVSRLTHEFGLKEHLDRAWAVRPLELVQERGRTILVLEDSGGEPLHRLLGSPMEIGYFLRLGTALTVALRRLHERGLVHKDIKPANVLVTQAGEVRLTGFGIASRLPRERQAPEPPEVIAGTLAYMAPEQTGRMNRSIDSRSDLYSLGVTLYHMLAGAPPFVASDPMEWVHCHVARKPAPPTEMVAEIPAAVAGIVMKLLAKAPEERYQTAAGVEGDLRRCMAEWQARRGIDEFALGEHDTPDRLILPERLYGRAHEVATLVASFDEVVAGGRPALVLVSGYSGIGKSSVVSELHKVLVLPRGIFASGKVDQYKRDVPYTTLAQAFEGLILSLLGKPEDELNRWREDLREALGPNGSLVADLVPELEFIVGEQPPVPELEAQDAKARFQLVLRRFIGVFARAEHPLALFLDDLQWLDDATLDLLEDLLVQPDIQHLMLVGAYRDNEVGATHPLMLKLDAIRKSGAVVRNLVLAPLAREDVSQLIADCLRCKEETVGSLAELIHQKTAGNPFFAIQFISALAEEGLLQFDHDMRQWRWDLDRIKAKGYTDNVVQLMVERLSRLPTATQQSLQALSCIGHSVDIATLSFALGTPEEEIIARLWAAARAELIMGANGQYKFAHDRIQEAAYSLIPNDARADTHLRIGRRLLACTPPSKREEEIFEIVSQLNRGEPLITSLAEREQLAELNLSAGKRAQASTAYASALSYLAIGRTLLADDCWWRRHDLVFALELTRAQCEFASGAVTDAEDRLALLAERAMTTLERTTVACLRVDLYMSIDRSDHAVAVGLDALRQLGIDWSPRPTEEEARREYDGIWTQLGGRTIESLISAPLITDLSTLATLDLLIRVAVPGFFASSHLFTVAVCRAVKLSLEDGNSDASCIAYELFAMLAGPHFGNYDAGYRFGRLGCDLVERPELTRFQARTYETFGFVIPWTKHVRNGRELLVRSLDIATHIGDITYSGYAHGQINTNLLFAGDPLGEVQSTVENGLAFAERVGFGLIVAWTTGQLRFIRTMRGLTGTFGAFDEEGFDEAAFERHLADVPALALPESWYWIRKLQARFFAGDYATAIGAAAMAQPKLWTSLSLLEVAEYHFYDALSRAAAYDTATAGEREHYLEEVSAHCRQIEIWAKNCPENFENRLALVSAERARIEGRELEAERFYEHAIKSARASGFVHNEALASELAARFHAARGFDTIADAYLRQARDCYHRWGAEGKVRQLDNKYRRIGTEEARADPSGTIQAPVEHLDLATVIKVSQTLSSEIVFEKLIDTIMRTAIEHAGAERGLLILPHEDSYRIEAEVTTESSAIAVELRQENVTATDLPESVLHYVLRTKQTLLLHDASTESRFAGDEYIRHWHGRSLLCMPLLKQTRLLGILYLENNLAAGVFTPARVAILKLLASEAAVSLENTRLYRELEAREARVRRLVDSNIIGIFFWDLDGRILDANGAFLNIIGRDRDDLAAGRLHWMELTPPEWREVDGRVATDMKDTGIAEPYEKEFFGKDGTRVPVLIGGAIFDGSRNEGVAFVVDLTDRKQAEEAARESERRYHEVQMDLAHANRVATMGQLAASIAHELSQPVGATVTNAETALLWMSREPANLEEIGSAVRRIVRDGKRAGDIIGRIRALIKKAPPKKDGLEINELLLEVLGLTRAELARNGVVLRTQFADNLPLIYGDRVQLQQVTMNLIINAVEAMRGTPDGERDLLINTAEMENGVRVVVRDSGSGLDETSAQRVFSPFYSTKPDGLGMGLSICRTIIESHGGKLWATPSTPRGAVLQFTLPASAED